MMFDDCLWNNPTPFRHQRRWPIDLSSLKGETRWFRQRAKLVDDEDAHSIYYTSYFSTVDDTSVKAGGTQVITTTDGHVFPLSLCHGLPYIAMQKYTTEEYSTLPHVVMMSDKHWDPFVLDATIHPQDDSFLQQYAPAAHQLPYPLAFPKSVSFMRHPAPHSTPLHRAGQRVILCFK
eukprot:jgi/Psemu1/7705/gm1.7705_g